jgi:hypothetical protein
MDIAISILAEEVGFILKKMNLVEGGLKGINIIPNERLQTPLTEEEQNQEENFILELIGFAPEVKIYWRYFRFQKDETRRFEDQISINIENLLWGVSMKYSRTFQRAVFLSYDLSDKRVLKFLKTFKRYFPS